MSYNNTDNIADKANDNSIIVMHGKKLASDIKNDIKVRIDKAVHSSKDMLLRPPTLAVILVGDDYASEVYVNNKRKACEEVGIKFELFRYPSTITEQFLLATIEGINKSTIIDGLLVQLPLPKHVNKYNILNAIEPIKDVDGLSPYNVGQLAILCSKMSYKELLAQSQSLHIPCTPKGIMALLTHYGVDLDRKVVAIIGSGDLVGKPMTHIAISAGATPILCHEKTPDIARLCSLADVIVTATGVASLVKADWVKKGAVVVDVGINRDSENKLCGDVDYDAVSSVASHITPVPGGVGPMTVALLLDNVVNAYIARLLYSIN